MATQQQPSQYDLQRAFNRTLLSREGYTFDSAMAVPCIKLSLTRVALAIAYTAPPSPKRKYTRSAIND
jgi:hypothetical protein